MATPHGSQMESLNAALEGRYRLEREIGAGGMATVYLATDIKHRRKVALKVLRPELSAIVGADRFLKEIETTANLQHPHILPLHDSGAVDGTAFYVMPFVEGETLRDRLHRETQLPVADAVRLTREIASALDYAHRKGVIHRDIKPENILLQEGQALVADFGIALAAATSGGNRITASGMSLGTPQYMSPEQAMAERTLDARADVFALGCVLYEMLVGEPPFTGPTAQAIAARVVTGAVEGPRVRRPTVPVYVNEAVLTALQKVPADRFASAAAMAEALTDRSPTPLGDRVEAAPPDRTVATAATPDREFPGAVTPVASPARASGAWNRITVATTAIATIAVLVAAWAVSARPSTGAARESPVLRMVTSLPDSLELPADFHGSLAFSPDGTKLVFSARRIAERGSAEDRRELWIRSMDQFQATVIAATRRAAFPRFSPDGRSVGYIELGTAALKVVDLDGGPPRTIADSGVSEEPIVFAPDGGIVAKGSGVGGSLMRFPAGNGPPSVITTVDRQGGEAAHVYPDVLPNNRGMLFTVQYAPNGDVSRYKIAVLDFATGRHRILTDGVAARFVSGYLLIVRANGELSAASFDQDAQQLTGPEIPIASDVRVNAFGRVDLATTPDGMLAYVAGRGAISEANLIWVARDGTVTHVDSLWRANFGGGAISPDGRELAVSIGEGSSEDIWVKQLDGGRIKLTSGGSRFYRPRWLPDGKRVSFLSEEARSMQLVMRRADGIGAIDRLARVDETLFEGFVSPDGAWVILRKSRVGSSDIFAQRIGDSIATPLLATTADERYPTISSDGKWIAYRSSDADIGEVFVRPFPNVNDGKWLVSLDGGFSPVWSRSGRELFYTRRANTSDANELWVATVTTSPTFRVRDRRKLFTIPRGVRGSPSAAMYDVAPGDQRFLMVRGLEDASGSSGRAPIVLVTNVLSALKRKADVN